MDSVTMIATVSIIMAGLTTAIGCLTPALGEAKAIAAALTAIAQQPDSTPAVTRTLFVGLAMVESLAIYSFVISIILIFANPYWNFFILK